MEKVKYVTYKVLIARERATSVFEDMITIPENKPYSEIPAFISAYVRTQLENKMLTEEERAEIHNENKTYEQGLADAWKAARKIAATTKNGGFSVGQIAEIFGSGIDHILNVCKPAEVIAKIKEYEDKQEEIKVGDELRFSSVATEGRLIIGIVFEITKYSDGNWAYHLWTPFELNKNYVLIKSDFSKRLVGKTGKHYPQVEELLKAMKEGQ